MPKCLVSHYVDPETGRLQYICRKGLTPSKVSLTADSCWRHNCPGIRHLPKPVLRICNHLNCTAPLKGDKSKKYCSPQCKSKESSRLYRLKKKNESLRIT